VTAGGDGNLQMWSVLKNGGEKNKPICYKGSGGPVTSVVWPDNDQQQFISGSVDGLLKTVN